MAKRTEAELQELCLKVCRACAKNLEAGAMLIAAYSLATGKPPSVGQELVAALAEMHHRDEEETE